MPPDRPRYTIRSVLFRLAMAVTSFATVCKLFWPGPVVRICGYVVAALISAVILMGADSPAQR